MERDGSLRKALATESNNKGSESESDAIMNKLEAVVEQRRQQEESEKGACRGESVSPTPSGGGLLQGAEGTEQEQRMKRSRMCSREPRHLRLQHRHHEGGVRGRAGVGGGTWPGRLS